RGGATRQLARLDQPQRRQLDGLRHDGSGLRQAAQHPNMTMSAETKAVRRIVTIDDDEGRSVAIADGPSPDVRGDAARPGFSSTRIWLTSSSPAVIAGFRDPVTGPHTIEPPRGGSVCRIVTFPPDDAYRDKVGAKAVAAFFHSMGSPGASTYSA